MNWIYFPSLDWDEYGKAKHGNIYFRPVLLNEADKVIMIGNMVIMKMVAVNLLFDTAENRASNSPEINEIFYQKMEKEEYYLEVEPAPASEKDYLLMTATLFLKAYYFDKQDVEDWIIDFLTSHEMPYTSLKEGTFNDFADSVPMMRMFNNLEKEGKKIFGDDFLKKGKG